MTPLTNPVAAGELFEILVIVAGAGFGEMVTVTLKQVGGAQPHWSAQPRTRMGNGQVSFRDVVVNGPPDASFLATASGNHWTFFQPVTANVQVLPPPADVGIRAATADAGVP
jgi:hypothetical protein